MGSGIKTLTPRLEKQVNMRETAMKYENNV